MKDVTLNPITLGDLTQFAPESTDPDYLSWRDAKIRAALAEAKAHPEKRLPQAAVWKKFGLES